MKTITKLLFSIISISLLFVFTSCNKDDDDPIEMDNIKSIVEIASDDSNFSTLVAALTKADLVSTLQGNGPFTVFAPTNDAFDKLLTDLGASSLDDLSAEQLKPILLYHVLSGKTLSTALKSDYFPTLSEGVEKENLQILINVGDVVKINGKAMVTQADIEATNGVIHVIDKVLLPPTVVDAAINNSNFSTLVSAVTKAGLVSTLSSDGPFTVFAPTNDAFTKLFSDLGVTGLDDLTKEQLEPILLYHVLSSVALSTDLSEGYVSTLSPGPGDTKVQFLVSLDGKATLNGDVNIVATDVIGTNGVVHVIDKVLLPPTVVDIAINNSDFSILVDAVVKAELATTLKGDGPFTVFAPTNAAFEALFSGMEGVSSLDDLTKEDLVPILQYHVVNGNVLSSGLTSGNVTTLNGDITINVGSKVTINTSTNVVLTDIQGKNGIVHVIDKVLVPPVK